MFAPPWPPELRAEREALSLIHWLRDQAKPQSEWLAAIAADQTLTELRRGGPTRPPIRPRMEAVGWDSVPTVLPGRNM